jgi:hypothetical protein
MQFEPVIPAGFEPRIQIGLNPFESACSNSFEKSPVRNLISRLLAALQLFYKSSENNLTDCFSHAAGFVGNSRSDDHFGVRREGGSK